MAETVVEGLEVVDVEECQAKGAPVAVGAVDLPLECRPEVSVVGEPGERVVLGPPQRLLVAMGIPERHRGMPCDRLEKTQVLRAKGFSAALVVHVDHTAHPVLQHERGADERAGVVAFVVPSAEAGIELHVPNQQGQAALCDVAGDSHPDRHRRLLHHIGGQTLEDHEPEQTVALEQEDRADLGVQVLERPVEQSLQHLMHGERRCEVPDRPIEHLELGVAASQTRELRRVQGLEGAFNGFVLHHSQDLPASYRSTAAGA